MATGTQQEFQAQKTAERLAEKPTNTSFFDDMFGEGNFSLDDESGELQLNFDKAEPQESETPTVGTGVASDAVSNTKPEDSAVKSPDAQEQRIASLESSLNQVLEVLANKIVPALNGKQVQQEQIVEDEEIDYSDASSLKKMIAAQIKQSLSEALGPLQQTQQKTEKYMEASEAFNKYGADFTEKIPVIRELMTVDTSLRFEDAYLLAKKLEQHYVKAQPANSNGNSQVTTTPTVTRSASALIDKANKLQTVSGVTPAGRVKPERMDIKAAFDEAWADLQAGSA